ncbi:MAG: hypothetical protein KZQ98_08650 [Candidatus Thiodiazotropha sp. (ex Lucinoma borealis)]|nr:hypothetical protein [Candidatus Thiodiazotropha sp. (ex Lucinoma borealis)]
MSLLRDFWRQLLDTISVKWGKTHWLLSAASQNITDVCQMASFGRLLKHDVRTRWSGIT